MLEDTMHQHVPVGASLHPHEVSQTLPKPDARQLLPWLIMAGTTLAAFPALVLYSHVLSLLGADRISCPIVLVVFASAAISSVAGFAFSAVCGAILLHLADSPAAAVQIMLGCSIGIQALSIWMLRREIEWQKLPLLLLGGLVGLPTGLWLLLHLSRAHYSGALGALLMLYGSWMLLRRPPRAWEAPLCTGPLAGLIGGITGGMAALPGPPITIWCNLQGWDKTRQRGLTQPFILLMQLSALAVLCALQSGSKLPMPVDLQPWAYLPGALAGTGVGLSVFRRLSERQFARAVNGLLIVSGLALLL